MVLANSPSSGKCIQGHCSCCRLVLPQVSLLPTTELRQTDVTSFGKLDSLATRPEPFTHTLHFFDALLEGDNLCQYDAVVIVEQPGVTIFYGTHHGAQLNVFWSSCMPQISAPFLTHLISQPA